MTELELSTEPEATGPDAPPPGPARYSASLTPRRLLRAIGTGNLSLIDNFAATVTGTQTFAGQSTYTGATTLSSLSLKMTRRISGSRSASFCTNCLRKCPRENSSVTN